MTDGQKEWVYLITAPTGILVLFWLAFVKGYLAWLFLGPRYWGFCLLSMAEALDFFKARLRDYWGNYQETAHKK